MTTPSQGPEAFERGNWGQAMDWLSNRTPAEIENLRAVMAMTPEQRETAIAWVNLDDRQQANLLRAANTDPLRDRVTNAARAAVAQVRLAYDRTQERISEAATRLATQAQRYAGVAAGAAVGAYEGTRNAVVQGARDAQAAVVRGAEAVGDRAEAAGQRIAGEYNRRVEQVTDLAQRGQVRLDQAWQAGADRLNETGRQIAEGARGARDAVVGGAREARDAVVGAGRDARDAVVGGARDARDAVRDRAVKVGRWFEGKFNGTMLKAEGVLANYNASRHDPSLQADTTKVFDGQGRLELIQDLSDKMNGPVTAAENDAIQNLAQASQAQLDAQTQNAARAGLSGVAPAQVGAGQTQTHTSEQGSQANVNLNKNKGTDIQR